MAQAIQIITGPQTLDINNGNPFRVASLRGLGLPPVSRLSERAPAQQGSTDLGFRVGNRTIFLALNVVAATRPLLEQYRDLLYRQISPHVIGDVLRLRVIRDDGSIRQIDCYYDGLTDLEFVPENRPGNLHRIVIPLTASNPVWYNPSLRNLTFTSVIGGASGFQIPMEVPWQQQPGSVLDVNEPVVYAGGWPEYPTIVVTGPATNLVITNVTTSKKLDFTGSSLGTADTYTIRTQFGKKDVLNQAGSSVFNLLTPDSDLDDWPLMPIGKVASGVNQIRIEATGTSGDTRVRIEYYDRFGAV